MTKLLLGLLLVSNLAKAESWSESWYETQNTANGKIILLNIDCVQPANKKIMKRMYTTAEEGKTSLGCWRHQNNDIYVIYDDNDAYTYPLKIFTFKQYK
jgi:hypothetical protein